MTVHVWSERRPTGGWHQCAGCAYLMALTFGGFTGYPLGAYTDAERDAFQPNAGVFSFAEVDADSQARYHFAIPSDPRALATLLATPGLCLAVVGENSRIPTRLHHWDPTYMGSHAVAVLTGTPLTWLDPEAPTGYTGDLVTAAEVLHWATPGINEVRAVRAGQFQEASLIVPTDTPLLLGDTLAGGTVYAEDFKTVLGTSTATAGVHVYGLARPRLTGKPLIPFQFTGKVGWVGTDKMTNLRLPNQPVPTKLGPGLYEF